MLQEGKLELARADRRKRFNLALQGHGHLVHASIFCILVCCKLVDPVCARYVGVIRLFYSLHALLS